MPRINSAQTGEIITKRLGRNGHYGCSVCFPMSPVPYANPPTCPKGNGRTAIGSASHTSRIWADGPDTPSQQGCYFAGVGDFARHNPIVQGVIGGSAGFNRWRRKPTPSTSHSTVATSPVSARSYRRLARKKALVNVEHGFTPHITLAYIPVMKPHPNLHA